MTQHTLKHKARCRLYPSHGK